MGKKSKKKGGGAASKAARKEKLQERREQQLEQLDQNPDDGGGGGNNEIVKKRPDREYFVGDRVWFGGDNDPSFDKENPNTYRGVVQAVNGEDLVIMSLQTLIDGGDRTHTINSNAKSYRKFVFPDFRGMTLRFDVGEKVICRSYGGSWDPATVTSFWPIFHIEEFDPPAAAADYIPHYKCDLLLEGGFATPPSDSDGCVQKRPTSFRFKVGDNVTFNSMKAEGDTRAAENYLQRTGAWTDGKITLVDVCEENLSYAVYKCTFKVATKKYSCFIYDDYDENIALADADPRKRLFDAIEQDCSRYHFIYLQTHFNIDIDAFRDLVMSKAIQFASYNALTWLQHDCNIDARLVKDKHGNNFLHMIANSQHASRFIRRLGENGYLQENTDDVKLDLIDHGRVRTTEKNNDGEIWLQSLVSRGDVKALDTALSPHCGLAWESYFLRGEVLGLLAASIKESKNRTMQCIFDEVVSFHIIFEQLDALQFIHAKSEDELLQDDRLSIFRGADAKRGAKLFTRFYRDWEYRLSQNLLFKRIFRTLVEHGMFRLFQLLYEADQGLFETDDYTNAPNEDRQQFIQEELRTDKDNGPTSLVTNISNACVLGSHSVYLYSKDFQNYARIVKSHFLMCDEDECPSLCHHLSLEMERTSHVSWKDLIGYRLRLLEDEADVKGRQNILDYLLLKHEDVRLDPLFILRHRQCWALRFMTDKKYLDLEGLAASEEHLARNASTLTFLSSGRIPPNMTIRCCLAFAAVQYDDLQSLEWLSKPLGAPSDVVDGWNLLHYCGFMGRIEIIGWLSTQPVWNSLVSQASTRKAFVGAYAVHIAASCGHLHACDLMIDLKVPLEDKKGKLPEDYAKKSRHEFVREWAGYRAKPQALKKDVEKLLSLVEEQKSVSQIKDFIISSKCLDMDRWRSCGIRNSQEKLLGVSFQEVLHVCCKSSEIELVKWICLRLYYCCSDHDYFAELFWGDGGKKLLSRNDIVLFARERGYDDLVERLQGKWFKDVWCNDPLARNPILESALGGDERLVDVRAAALRIDALVNVAKTSLGAIEDTLRRGGRVDELDALLIINTAAMEAVKAETSYLFPSDDERYLQQIHYSVRSFKINERIRLMCERTHSVSLPLLYREDDSHFPGGNEAHIILATEGYTDLLHFCLSNIQGWTAVMELNVIRVASFFGHTSIVEMLLYPSDAVLLHSDKNERFIAAILGTSQALRYRDLESLMALPTGAKGVGRDKGTRIEGESFKDYFQSDSDDEDDIQEQMMNRSLLVAVLTGYVRETFDTDEDNRVVLKTLRLLVDKNMYNHDEILYAMELLFRRHYMIDLRYLDLLQCVVDTFRITLISHSKEIQKICELVIRETKNNIDPTATTANKVLDGITNFFSKMAKAGIDIQEIGKEDLRFHSGKVDFNWLTDLKQTQLDDWSRFDIVKKGGSLADIKQSMKDRGLAADTRDRGGTSLTHLSAAYDRVDLLEWLVVEEGMDLDALDAQHRTTLDVAKASKASSATKWIVEWKAKATIGSFLRRNYYQAMYRRRIQQSNDAATLIQSVVRAYATRKIFANVLLQRMEESQRFTAVWGRVIDSVGSFAKSASWVDIREQLIDIKVGLDDEMLDDTDQKLSTAMEEAVQDESCGEGADVVADDDIIDFETLVTDGGEDEELTNSNSQWLSFQMTSHVVKFLQQGDKKYRSFFVRRMRQLASGERSRILQKPLKGSKTLIFETYLEQKSGHRILWTEERGSLVIWYIAKHKQVNRLMQLIDDSKSRSARQQMPAALVSELQNEGLLNQDEPKKEVLIDIFGNTPLKIYDVNFNAINEITKDSWTPRLHLTDEERDIVEADGTVLVLGRSGTGKTICICSSIEFDRQSVAARDPSFTQLFVARSVRLCRYVEGAVGEDNRTSFLTYGRLLNDIESTLGQTRNFNPSQRIDFGRFRRDFHNCSSSSNENISALISWTVIRTFLKGSVEAFQSPDGILPRDEFVEVERLGKNRCRIPAELREQVYDEFLQYQKYLEDQQLWDDCDRVRHLLLCINRSKKEDPEAFDQVKRSKVYVDEVQDYTQLEILLFFYLSGPNGLFLAGDPAQSVVEGTEFRFDEVRGVGHFVGSVIQKPKTVNVNFRSHSGILNCAGGVLDILFTHFPSSAKQLKKDEGLFQGSRPGVLSGTSINQLNTLLGDKLKGAVVLTHDDSARHWRRLLNDYKLVYGIREAKGLEFKTVIILDFFREIPSSLQKPWRELVLGRATQDFERSHPLGSTFLKLLYTGVTRCIEKLFFVETKSSTAGDASMRWLTKKVSDRASYATRNSLNDVEAMSMTSDEFISEGINNAELAQATELEQSQMLLERSIWCFEQTDNIDLAVKARTHFSSVLFRLELEIPCDEKTANDCAVIEMRAAQLMESLSKEGLFFEVLNIFSSVTPFLTEYTKEELEKRFIRKVRLSGVGEE